MPGIQTILHPTDFSENSRPAFETACILAREYDATLLLLHVMMPSVSVFMQGPRPSPLKPLAAQRSGARLPWPQPSDPRVRVEHRLAEGEPAEEILRLAEAEPCDLIVMGAHVKTGLERFLTVSVGENVVRQARCGVLVVNTPRPTTPDLDTEAIAEPGDPIDLRPPGTAPGAAGTRTLVRGTAVELVRMTVPAGQEISQQKSQGEMIVHCLEGRVVFTALGKIHVLEAGTLLLLPAGEPHTFQGIEDASLLLTILVPKP